MSFVLALLVVSSTALHVKILEEAPAPQEAVASNQWPFFIANQSAPKDCNADCQSRRPKSARPEEIELLWQRPIGEPKGILLYLHGCHGKATGMWTSDGPDGFHFDVCDTTKKKKCMGYVEEILLRQKARKAGYLVAAVSGGVGNPRGCMNTNDVPRIQLAMKYLVEQEKDMADKPVIMLGHSSGGRVLPELLATGAGIRNAKCIVPVADEIRVKGDSSAPLGVTPNFPEDVNVLFVHMTRDEAREENIDKNIHQMAQRGARTHDIKVNGPQAIDAELFHADGYGLDKETSEQIFKVLQKEALIDTKRMLVRNPYATGGDTWQEVLKKKKGIVDKAGGFTTLQAFLDVAWSEHWMAGGRYWNEIQEFCEKPGFTKTHQGGDPNFDLVSKVHDIDRKAEAAKAWADKHNPKLKKKGAHLKKK